MGEGSWRPRQADFMSPERRCSCGLVREGFQGHGRDLFLARVGSCRRRAQTGHETAGGYADGSKFAVLRPSGPEPPGRGRSRGPQTGAPAAATASSPRPFIHFIDTGHPTTFSGRGCSRGPRMGGLAAATASSSRPSHTGHPVAFCARHPGRGRSRGPQTGAPAAATASSPRPFIHFIDTGHPTTFSGRGRSRGPQMGGLAAATASSPHRATSRPTNLGPPVLGRRPGSPGFST